MQAVPEATDSSSEGQADERQWKHGMSITPSQLDVSVVEPEAMHSRLLTKKQLSDMAWGVRELSRRLGSMRLKSRIKNIFLLTKIHDEDLISKTRELTKWLLARDRDVRYTVFLEKELRNNKKFNLASLVDELRQSYGGARRRQGRRQHQPRHLQPAALVGRPHVPHAPAHVRLRRHPGRRRHRAVRQLALPAHRAARAELLARQPRLPAKFEFNDFRSTLTTAFRDGVTVSLRLRFEATVMRSSVRPPEDAAPAPAAAAAARGGGPKEEGAKHAAAHATTHATHGRDLVDELIGEEKDDEHTHRPNGDLCHFERGGC